jgi:hypothetical protein
MIEYQTNGPINPVEEDGMQLKRLLEEKNAMERTITLINTCDSKTTTNKKALRNITKAYCRAIYEIERRIEEIEK